MNEMPPDKASDEVDDLYRHAAALDPSRPSESTRRSILNHATRVAADRAAQPKPIDTTTARRSVQRPWRSAKVGTLASAVLAGLVVMPRFWNTPPSPLRLDASAPSTSWTARIAATPSSASPPADFAQAQQDSTLEETSNLLKHEVIAPDQAAPSLPPAKSSQRMLGATLPRLADSSAGLASADTFGHSRSVEAPRAQANANALHRAALADDIPALNRALGQSVDVNGRDEAGRTALMVAILAGHGDAVDVLLAHGADPSAVDANGVTPLEAAKNRGKPAIVSVLLRAGAR